MDISVKCLSRFFFFFLNELQLIRLIIESYIYIYIKIFSIKRIKYTLESNMQHYTLILIFKFKCCIENQEFVIVKKKLILVFLLCMFCMHQSTSEYFQTSSEKNKWKNYFKLTYVNLFSWQIRNNRLSF